MASDGSVFVLVCGVELSGRAIGVTNSLIPIENGRLKATGWHIGAISCTTSITVYVTCKYYDSLSDDKFSFAQ